jgi:hypothetical protein
MTVKTIYFLIIVSVLGSCASSKQATSNEITTQESNVYQKSLVGELEVDLSTKMKGTSVNTVGDVEEAKKMACWDAIEAGGAHAIIEPIYTIERVGRTVTCTVKGYPGKYKSITTASEQDLLNYVRSSLLTEQGILQVSYPQFKAFYYSLAENDEYAIDEAQLYEYYTSEYEAALENETKNQPVVSQNKYAKSSQTPQTKSSGGGVILVLLLLALVTVVVGVIVQ